MFAFSAPRLLLHYKANKLEQECFHSRPTPECVVRMRAMGHMLSAAGNVNGAEKWYKQAASVYDAESMFHIGWLYFQRAGRKWQDNGGAVDAEMEEARVWFLKAAHLGFAPAMNNLGMLYAMRQNSHEISRSWLVKAAGLNNPVAMWNLVARKKYYRIRDVKKWAYWHPHLTNAAELRSPVLERTLFGAGSLPSEMQEELRAAAKEKRTFQLYSKSTGLFYDKEAPVMPFSNDSGW